MKKEIIEWLKSIVITLAVFAVLLTFFGTTMVFSTSMNPTLVEKDLLFLIKFGSYKAGDIVSFKSNLRLTERDVAHLNFLQKIFNRKGKRKNLVKRIIGGPGDVIEIRDGYVFINDQMLSEPYIHGQQTLRNVERQMIPEDKFFVMGDNRVASLDSRELGFVDRKDLIGKVIFRLFPFHKIGTLD